MSIHEVPDVRDCRNTIRKCLRSDAVKPKFEAVDRPS
jgi:hypothetical protein